LKVIITGATGMVGEGVMLECLESPAVDEVLLVSRRPYGASYPKLKEYIVPDFMNLDAVADQLKGYDGCFFCAGVSSVGKKRSGVHAPHLRPHSEFCPDAGESESDDGLRLCFGRDDRQLRERPRNVGAREGGALKMRSRAAGFRAVYNFRPGMMRAMPGQRESSWPL
jgi:hypothetical protein